METLKYITDGTQTAAYQPTKQTSAPPTIAEETRAQLAELQRRRNIVAIVDLTDAATYVRHSRLWAKIANELLAKEGRTFRFDEYNKTIIRGLLYYFNQCPLVYTEPELQYIGADGEPERDANGDTITMFDLNKNIVLMGGVGSGKTLIMRVFAEYLKRTRNPLQFRNASATELLNHYKVNNTLDAYTYNCGTSSFEGEPRAICLHDVGLQTQKFYGNDLQSVIDEYFHARNEIWTQQGVRSYVTTNLCLDQLRAAFDDGFGRLNDRWKTYNFIYLEGGSRR